LDQSQVRRNVHGFWWILLFCGVCCFRHILFLVFSCFSWIFWSSRFSCFLNCVSRVCMYASLLLSCKQLNTVAIQASTLPHRVFAGPEPIIGNDIILSVVIGMSSASALKKAPIACFQPREETRGIVHVYRRVVQRWPCSPRILTSSSTKPTCAA
jgi:hypothetical protein